MKLIALFFTTLVSVTVMATGSAVAQGTESPAATPEATETSKTAPQKAASPAAAANASALTDDEGTAFVTMDPANSQHQEELPGFPFLYSAYTIIWLGLFFYLISLNRRQRALDQKIAELSTLVSNRSSQE